MESNFKTLLKFQWTLMLAAFVFMFLLAADLLPWLAEEEVAFYLSWSEPTEFVLYLYVFSLAMFFIGLWRIGKFKRDGRVIYTVSLVMTYVSVLMGDTNLIVRFGIEYGIEAVSSLAYGATLALAWGPLKDEFV